MIKIFQLITSIDIGGAEIIAFNLVDGCNKKYPTDFEFVIVELYSTTNKYSVEKKKELISKKNRIVSLFGTLKRISLVFAPFCLTYQIIKEKPHIIHSHTDLPDFVLSTTIRILKFFKINTPRIIRTIHNTELWPTHNFIGKYTEVGFNNDTIVGVSEASLIAYFNLRAKFKLLVSPYKRVIFNGCKIPQKAEIPFHLNKSKINIAFCGRFEYQKGIDVLIERIIEINILFPDKIVFHIIGSGTYKKEIQNLTNTTGNILLYDAVPNIADKLYAFDFLIMPSRFEGLVLLSIEASLSRLPVIATFAAGLAETLPEGWPMKFHLENSEELISIIQNIIENKYSLETLKDNAYSYVSRKFSLEQMINSYSELYNSCLK